MKYLYLCNTFARYMLQNIVLMLKSSNSEVSMKLSYLVLFNTFPQKTDCPKITSPGSPNHLIITLDNDNS